MLTELSGLYRETWKWGSTANVQQCK